jgi:exonuclease VII small subunit
MTAPLPTAVASLKTQLETAALSLQDALAEHAGAVVAVAEAKRALELARARLICQGVEGKNEAQREACIRLELHSLFEDLHEGEQTLTEARCSLERARLEWDLARYTLRALEVGA